MNIFKILSSNDGTINEPNVSSFLAYLLNPNEDHGLSSLLLQEILNDFLKIDKNYLTHIKFNNRITDLSKNSKYTVEIQPEFTVFIPKKNRKRDIDILIEIYESKNKLLYSFCLENKITDSSIARNDNQLQDEINGIINYYKSTNLNPEIYLIYLTPEQSKISDDSFNKLTHNNKLHLYWLNHQDSILNKMLKIYELEKNGLIDPINEQSKFLINSFLSFINNGFICYAEEKQNKFQRNNYGKPVMDHLNDFSKNLKKNKDYTVKYIRDEFDKYVFKKSGVKLHEMTRNAHILTATVNEKNRVNYHVNRPDDKRKNIFYYPDVNDNTILRLFDSSNANVEIFYKNHNLDCPAQ